MYRVQIQGLLRLGGAQGREPPQESPEDCEPEVADLIIDVVVYPGSNCWAEGMERNSTGAPTRPDSRDS